MKKLILSVCILFTAATMQAQIGSASANVNVIISDIHSITINNGSTVNININTQDHFINGNFSEVDNHILITSTQPYHVNVKATVLTDGTESISLDNLHVTLSNGTGGVNSSTVAYPAIPSLALTDQTVISATGSGDIQRFVKANYKIDGGDALLVTAGTYTTTVMYSLILD